MIKKKLAAVLLVCILTFAFIGCDKTPEQEPPPAGGIATAPDFSAHRGDDLVVGGYIGNARRYAGYASNAGKAEYRALYAQYAKEAGLNTIFGLRLAQIAKPSYVEEILDACEQNNVKMMLSMQGLTYPNDVADYVGNGESSPAFLGYDFWDEPGASQYAALEKQMAVFKQDHPDKNAFVNLLPSYATWGLGGQLQAQTYSEYVQKFTETCPSVSQVCLDHYPLIGDMAADVAISSQLSEDWLSDLEENANAAKAAGKDFWCYTQGMAYGNRRVPESAADLTFQNYVSMCFGVKGLIYFCLDTPGEEGDPGEFSGMVYGMIDRDGNKTVIHDYAAAANAQLKSFGYVYKQFAWEDVMAVSGSEDGDNIAFENLDSPLRSSEHFTASANHDTLIGTFTHAQKGLRGYMVVPYVDPHLNHAGTDFMYPDTQVTLTFKSKQVLVYGNGESKVVEIPNGMYTATLRPGQGQFIVPFD